EVLLAGVDVLARVVARGAPPPHADRPSPGTPLPRAPTTEKKPIPAEIPYLAAPAERLEKWRARMDGLARPRVAMAWAGNPAHANDRHRSIPLARFAPLWSLDGPTFVSVQREVREADRDMLAGTPRLPAVGRGPGRFRRSRGRAGVRGSRYRRRQRGRASRRRARPAGVGFTAVLARLALDARARRQPLVSNRQAVSPARDRRL